MAASPSLFFRSSRRGVLPSWPPWDDGGNVGPTKSLCISCHSRYLYSFRHRLLTEMDGKDRFPILLVRHHHLHDVIEASRPEDRGVQHIQAVGRPQDEDPGVRRFRRTLPGTGSRSVPRHESDDPALRVGTRGVDFIEEDDRGRLSRLVKDLPDPFSDSPTHFRHQGRPLDGDEIHLALRGNRLGYHRLAAHPAGRREEYPWAASRLPFQKVGILQGPLHGLDQRSFREDIHSHVVPSEWILGDSTNTSRMAEGADLPQGGQEIPPCAPRASRGFRRGIPA